MGQSSLFLIGRGSLRRNTHIFIIFCVASFFVSMISRHRLTTDEALAMVRPVALEVFSDLDTIGEINVTEEIFVCDHTHFCNQAMALFVPGRKTKKIPPLSCFPWVLRLLNQVSFRLCQNWMRPIRRCGVLATIFPVRVAQTVLFFRSRCVLRISVSGKNVIFAGGRCYCPGRATSHGC